VPKVRKAKKKKESRKHEERENPSLVAERYA
jgi:hypothetical protein